MVAGLGNRLAHSEKREATQVLCTSQTPVAGRFPLMFTLEQEVPAIISFSTASSRFSLEGIRATARANFKAIFEQHRHRVYSLAFWMTDNEMTAEEISGRTFLRAFRSSGEIDQKAIDSSLVSELREITSIGQITLNRPVMDQK